MFLRVVIISISLTHFQDFPKFGDPQCQHADLAVKRGVELEAVVAAGDVRLRRQ